MRVCTARAVCRSDQNHFSNSESSSTAEFIQIEVAATIVRAIAVEKSLIYKRTEIVSDISLHRGSPGGHIIRVITCDPETKTAERTTADSPIPKALRSADNYISLRPKMLHEERPDAW
jgi:hypothetical protein